MNEKNKLPKGNEESVTERNNQDEDVEGYAYCQTHRARCLNDCGGGGKATPFLSDLN
ncbi:hypothetical protein M2454_001447 [Aequitasia blattaphilus]|uniref:Uncharacterized protein n=1 Tax=Aequitasia blattaphilus TaxID=2949332 RepID=A0ABT1ECI1_9FIRM|nr:hypothetical protein [Aequitasia blattaphilus]MCP1103359.1 hypothetical protein [Aequitasia blattaphilus]MCR8615999.1 hypothetical protein [Aequitasia blattaphilus]